MLFSKYSDFVDLTNIIFDVIPNWTVSATFHLPNSLVTGGRYPRCRRTLLRRGIAH